MVPLFGGVPLLLRWCSAGILGCFDGVPGGVSLLILHCPAGVSCSAVPRFGVPGFIVWHCLVSTGLSYPNSYSSGRLDVT